MHIKRTLSLLLTAVLLLSVSISLQAEEEDGNLLPNPHFDRWNSKGTFAASWGRSPASAVTLSEDYHKSGAYSIKITQKSADYANANATVENIVGGAEYAFGVYVRAMQKNSSLRFRYTCFGEDDTKPLYDQSGDAEYMDFPGDWDFFTETFRPPRGTVKMEVQLRLGQAGTVYCDDVSMRLTDGPEKIYDFKTDGTFYYAERERDGIVSAKADTVCYDTLIGKTLSFSLIDPDAPTKPLLEKETKIMGNEEIKFSFPMRLMSVLQKPYQILCNLIEDGKITATKSHTVYKFERPKRINEDGFFLDENGEIFTPSVMYRVDYEDFDTVKEVGVNAVQGYPSAEWLTTLDEKEMKCFVVLYSDISAGNKNRISTAIKYVNEYKGYDAVLGWLVFDEPSGTDEGDLAELVEAYTQIRAIDPDHPIIFTANDHYDILHQYADVIIQDSYPYANDKFTTYPYERNKKAIAESDGRPVYSLMQTFEFKNSFPQPKEIRNMQYASLWAGVKGIGYFKYEYSEVAHLFDEKKHWQEMKSFAAREQEIAFDLFIYEKYKKIDEMETDDYMWGVWEDGDGYLVLLRSKKYDADVSAEIPISGDLGAWRAEPIGGTMKDVWTGDGKIGVTIEKGDVVLFRAEKTAFVDEAGKPITTLSGGMTVKVVDEYEMPDTENPMLCVAVYCLQDGNAECIYLDFPDVTPTVGTNGAKKYRINEEIKIPEGKGEYNMKIFYWNQNLNCLQKAVKAI